MILKATTKRKCIVIIKQTGLLFMWDLLVYLISIFKWMKLIPDECKKIEITFTKILCKLLKCIYQLNNYISNITKPPWIMTDVDRLIRKKQQLYNKAKKSKTAADWVVYKKSNIKCVGLFECNLTSILLVLSIP